MKNGLLKKRAALAVLIAAALAASSCNDSEMFVPLGMIDTVRIHAGTFTMGGEEGFFGQRQVTLTAGFYMGRFPVTQGEWVAVMGSNPVPGDSVHYGRWRPVVDVSWFDAIVFANRLSIRDGLSPAYRINGSTNPDRWGEMPTGWDHPNIDAWNSVEMVDGSTGWRLLTEAQWEYAARAGTTTMFSNGAQSGDDPSVDEIAWTSRNSGGRTHNVGTRAANPWGLHDMHGNVWEWVWDSFGALGTDPVTDPTGASSGSYRVNRGGSWFDWAQAAGSAISNANFPFVRFYGMGVRLVRP